MLSLAGVCAGYGSFRALFDISLDVKEREAVGVIGPNGAGKTTLVNLLTGVERPDAGRIGLGGVDLTGLAPHRIAALGVMRTFQVARLFANLSVRENLMVAFLAATKSARMRDGLARADDLLGRATLAGLADAPAGTLSGGQRMLLQACAGFMVPDVRLHVLDEPFAGINPVVKDVLISLIERENAGQARAFLIVSHEMAIVRRLCPIVTVMVQGRVAAEGSLEEIARKPEIVAAYLGRAAA